jgi:hypothetical protein
MPPPTQIPQVRQKTMQNQTEELWLTDSSPAEPGTGVFVFPQDKSTEFGPSSWVQPINSEIHGLLTKALISNIIYGNCAKLGEKDWVLAYRWIPASVAPYPTVLAAAQACTSTRCVRRCASYGCLCISGACK